MLLLMECQDFSGSAFEHEQFEVRGRQRRSGRRSRLDAGSRNPASQPFRRDVVDAPGRFIAFDGRPRSVVDRQRPDECDRYDNSGPECDMPPPLTAAGRVGEHVLRLDHRQKEIIARECAEHADATSPNDPSERRPDAHDGASARRGRGRKPYRCRVSREARPSPAKQRTP